MAEATHPPVQRPCEVIIVLGAAVWPGAQPSPALKRRVDHAIQALQTGRGAWLLVTGGLGKHPPAEAHLMRQLALDAGVRTERILIEDTATSTFQSAIRCTHILQQHGWSTALIVTDRYHLPRTLLLFRSFGIRALGSAPRGTRYSRKRWKRWYYPLREALAFVCYLPLMAAIKVRCLGRRFIGYVSCNARRSND